MKKLLSYLAMTVAVAMAFLSASCASDTEERLNQIQKQIDEIERRRTDLETDTRSLSQLIEAVRQGDELISFSPIAEDGVITGFKVVFKDAGEVTVFNRDSNIGVFMENGRYYWMVDGQPLIDDAGNKVEIAPETPLPLIRNTGGILEISVDGGYKYEPIGVVDKCLISNVVEDAVKVVITLNGGAQIIIPKYNAIILVLEGDQITIGAGDTIYVTYNIEGVKNAELSVLCGSGWSASVTPETDTSGTIKVTAPSPIGQDEVIVFASDGKGRMVAVKMRLTIDTSGNPDPPAPEVILNPIPAAYDVPLQGGEVIAALITNVDYSVETSAPWLHYNGTKAVRTDNLSFFVDANDDVPRAAFATINSGNYSTTIAFSQAGIFRNLELSDHSFGFGSDGGRRLLVVTANVPYTFEVSHDWVSINLADGVTNSNYVVTVEANPNCEARTATITFTGDRVEPQILEITQGGQTPYLTVTGGPFAFDQTGGSGTITVSSNVDYSCEVEGDWLAVSGEPDIGVVQFTLNVDANDSFEIRTATITFSCDHLDAQVITITQAAIVPYFNLTKTSFFFECGGGGGQFSVLTNLDYTYIVSDDAQWLSVSHVTTNTGARFTLIASTNESFSQRSATITFEGESFETQVVTINQAADVPYLTISKDSFTFDCDGDYDSFTVSANLPYTYTVSEGDWLTLTESGTAGGGKIYSLEATVNDTFETRTATITFSTDLVEPKTLTVTQNGQTPFLTVSPGSFSFDWNGGSGTITVTSNVVYTVTVEGSGWLMVSDTPEVGRATFSVTASSNNSYETRSASIIVAGDGVRSQTLMVVQNGKPVPIPRAEGGGNLYTAPSSGYHYRYGPTIIRNSDGSLDVWTSKPGDNYLYYGEYAYQETGSRSKKAAAGHTFAQYFKIQHRFRAIQIRMYGTGSSADNIVIKLYKWAGSYSATLATTPIASKTFSNIATGGNYYRTYRSDQAWMGAGEYLWTATDATSGVSISAYPGSGTSSIEAAVSYVNGTSTDSYNYEMRPRGRTTSNYANVDFFTYFHSTDGGVSWTKERDVLFGTEGSEDEWSVCDPGSAYFGGWYYLAYTSAPKRSGSMDGTKLEGRFNHCYIARSRTPQGPWYKWNGSGWGGEPAKVVEFKGDPREWGCGEPSIVVKDNTVYFYHSLVEGYNKADADGKETIVVKPGTRKTKVLTASVSDDWPAHLVDRGVAFDQTPRISPDSADVKYVEDYDLFYAFHNYYIYTSLSKIAVWTSQDGIRFTYKGDMAGSFQLGSANLGVSGDGEGHIRLSEQQYLGYAYGINSWGCWSTWFGPIYFE